jgi:hypothetical protein
MPDESEARPKRSTRSNPTSSAADSGASGPAPTKASTVRRSPAGSKPAASRASGGSKAAVAVPVIADSALDSVDNAAPKEAAPGEPTNPPVRPGDVSIQQGGIGAVTAGEVTVSQGGIGAVQAERVSLEQGGIGAAMAGRIDIRQGLVGAVIAGEARLEQAGARTLIANRVTFGPNSGAVVVLAARSEGNVRPVFDWRAGLAFGLAAGLISAILRIRRS